MSHHRELPSLVVIGLLPLALAACNHPTSSIDPRTQTPLVRVAAVQTSAPAERSFTGVVAARVQSDLGFRVPGKVLERLVDTGQTVKRGQPLMRIDPTDLRLATRAHEEAVAAATARARQNADGVVVEALAEPGQVVGAGQVVVRVAHAGRREAVIELPETLRPAIGSTGRVSLYGSGLAGPAKLRQLSDAANSHTRTFEARYVLAGRLADAPLGSTISIEIPDGRSAQALRVPIGAIFDHGKGPGVWLVEAKTAQVTWRA